ncbi:hypothetical protein NP493_912g00009 [Ridgeia piscesae]|uniref:Uncharacterized protein n=1 Tax=Ridgeia piscesae TaxID=27915 RepID=A0AAD9NJV3_RIDPI|nr:hypothetical protein NP493_912g00009 [Ridgeia piscesae]
MNACSSNPPTTALTRDTHFVRAGDITDSSVDAVSVEHFPLYDSPTTGIGFTVTLSHLTEASADAVSMEHVLLYDSRLPEVNDKDNALQFCEHDTIPVRPRSLGMVAVVVLSTSQLEVSGQA